MPSAPIEPRRRPNVLLINCDDLGYGDLGCYGSTLNETPHLDELAEQGVLFTDFYMASPVCSPSRGALLTGCYPPRIGFGDFNGLSVLFPGFGLGLHPDEVTIAKVLSDSGYATKAVGKWHCGDQPPFLPTRHGFDGYYGIPYSNDMGRQVWPAEGPTKEEVLASHGLAPDALDQPPLPLLLDEEVLEQQPDQTSLTSRFVDEGLRFIRRNADRPWFLYLAHIYVHLPLYVPETFVSTSRNGTYGGAVAAIDWAAGVLLAELRRLGLEDDTVVIFTSDNGSRGVDGGSNAPLRGAKAWTWEGGMRVPFIVRWPGRVPAGSRCSAVATSMDLYPTLAALAGADVPQDRVIDGRDISALLTGTTDRSPHDAFFYYRGNDLEAVRAGRWKLHVARRGEPVEELYDLDADPSESTDLAGTEREVVLELAQHADRARADLGDARLGIKGSGNRPVGEVDNPTTLTTYDPSHPYFMAEYDLADRG
jgi:arylsulfatase A-like enzyme